jgi:AIG2-like family
MTNPVSLETRKLSPYVSIPGEALDYKLYFYGGQGMAEALPEEGKSFHGVLHKMSPENMVILDKMEADLTRVNVNVKLYDGSKIVATIYSRPNVKERNSVIDKPPTERYLDIII